MTDRIPIETAEFGLFAAANGDKRVASALCRIIATGESLRYVCKQVGVPISTVADARARLRKLGNAYREWRAECIENDTI